MGQLIKKVSLIIFSLFFCTLLIAEEHPEHSEKEDSEQFNPGEMITHHIADSHEWHFAAIGHKHITIPLPVILYSADRGLEVFSSSNLSHGAEYNGYKLDGHNHIQTLTAGRHVYDLSITKNVASLFLSAILLLGIFLTVASSYKNNKGKAPKGLQSFFEPIIVFVRDDIAKGIIGPKYERYLPYLLTIFFFIWFNNLLGLMPGGANLTGNIAVTLFLATFTFLITIFSANKYYWGHIFNTPGVPHLLKPIIVPIEIIGMFTKPFSLTVRLFANITAGHIIILSLLGLIFIFKSVAASLISLPFAIFMTFLELFVAILQAYIFTLLSAMYIGSAVEEHHADHSH
jgi:F-type H+-transporting ATPase subunit a